VVAGRIFCVSVLYRIVYVATTLLSLIAGSAACSSAACSSWCRQLTVGLTFQQHTTIFATDKSVVSWLAS
jgi:hypothetical protein